jgi:predicted DNA-binding transcriptional regulator AlpA
MSRSPHKTRHNPNGKANTPILTSLTDDRIMSFDEFCKLAGISIATLRRLVKAPQGPSVTRMSLRRVGIRVRDAKRWLDAQVSAQTSSPEIVPRRTMPAER